MAEETSDSDRWLLAAGGILSLVSLSGVFYTYRRFPSLRRHPNGLVIQQCLFNAVFCAQFVFVPFLDVDADGDDTLTAFLAWLTQYTALGSELIFATISYDLYQSLRNPFSSTKLNVIRSKVFTVVLSAAMATALIALGPDQYGKTSFSIVWIQSTEDSTDLNVTKFVFFYLWLVVIYFYALFVIYDTQKKLSSGMSSTLQTRQMVFRRSSFYVLGYSLYWVVPGILYLVNWAQGSHDDNNSVVLAFELILASRGVVTLGIWVKINWADLREMTARARETLMDEDIALNPHLNAALRTEVLFLTTVGIQRAVAADAEDHGVRVPGRDYVEFPLSLDSDEQAFAAVSRKQETVSRVRRQSSSLHRKQPARSRASSALARTSSMRSSAAFDAAGGTAARAGSQSADVEMTFNSLPAQLGSTIVASPGGAAPIMSPAGGAAAPVAMGDDDDDDDSGDLVTRGNPLVPGSSPSPEPAAIAPADDLETGAGAVHGDGRAQRGGGWLCKEDAPASPAADAEYVFRDYSPVAFEELRALVGIPAAAYSESLSRTTKERFSEGASGAFMLWSGDERYIVKTMSRADFNALRELLPAYVEHMKRNPHTLLVRFYGLHSLSMYGKTLYFVVMNNVLLTDEPIHERFDLKGSWVSRHGELPRKGKRATCRACGERFVVGQTGLCFNRPNRPHEANVVLKDNDLLLRLQLGANSAVVAEQIKRDVSFLAGHGLMDYSLLVGVHRRRFEIAGAGPGAEGEGGRASSASVASAAPSGVNSMRLNLDEGPSRLANGGLAAAVVEGPGTYYIGIIDVLQEWTWEKKLERFAKTYIKLRDPEGISCVPPDAYATRFKRRVVDEIVAARDEEQL